MGTPDFNDISLVAGHFQVSRMQIVYAKLNHGREVRAY
jgi:hypothetical protein